MSQIHQVLVIGYVWPEPASSAAGKHMLSLLRAFVEKGWRVTFASPSQRSEHRIALDTLGIEEVDIALNCSSFDEYVARLRPQLVLFDRFMLEEQYGWRVAKACPAAMRVLDTEDLHFLRHARHQAHKQKRVVTQQDLMGDMAKREVAAMLRSDLSLIISDAEWQLLTEQFRIDPALLHHCPFLLDLDSLQTTQRPAFAQRQHFISIGNFRHAPNWDAVLWLQQLWPAIRKRLPEAECHVYGAYPPPKATQLHNPGQGFLIKGWAKDAFEVMQGARVCLAPLRFGAGIKGKLADAMLCGTPSVTTRIGAEGMCDAASWPGAVSDEADDIVNAAVELYTSETQWQQAQQQGYRVLRQKFDQTTLVPALLSRLESLYAELPRHRLNNFTGAMLQHHQHKSTQYMSQWIEAKNRLQDSD